MFSHSLITSKSTLAKKDLSKPRLKLEAAHMSTNLAENDKTFWNKLRERTLSM